MRETVAALQKALPTLRATVLVPHLDPDATLEGTVPWAELTATAAPLEFTPVPFDQPLWVLYSSGTTGLPKGIVQSHGGIVVEHLKALALQYDLGPGDRFLWFTTTGWMMWNFLVGGLLVGSTVVLYDGSPGHPDLDVLWAAVERHQVGVFGTSAPFLQACQKAGLAPGERHDLSGVRTLGSTGSPLAPEQFAWIAESVGAHVQICSMSGGTDVCTAFIASAPTVPVWLGELSCAALGADIHAVDEKGEDVPLSNDPADVGELVINQPMPSMPVALWADPDGSRLREAYFADFPGRWRHGDWLRATPRGSFVISGRSDSTLNRGGVRMGTADFYAVIEGFDEVVDSLVIDTTALGSTEEGALVCFLVLADGASLVDVEPSLRTALRKELSPRHVPDRFVLVDEVPRTLSGKKCEVPVKTDPGRRGPGEGGQPGGAEEPRGAGAVPGDGRAVATGVGLREVRGRQGAQHREGVQVGRDVAARRPAAELGGRAAGDQGAGEVEVGRPEHDLRVVHGPAGGPGPGVADERDRRQVLDPPGEPAGEPLADRPQPVGVLAARDAKCAAQVLLVDDHVAERADVVRPHPRPEGFGDRLPLGDERGDVAVAPLGDVLARPRVVVVVRLVTGDDVHAEADHVREEVAHGPVRARGHRHRGTVGRQVRHQVDHPLLGPAPLRDGVHGHTQPPGAPCRPARPRALPGCAAPGTGAGPRVPRWGQAPPAARSTRRVGLAPFVDAPPGLPPPTETSPSASAVTAEAGPAPLTWVPDRGVVSTPGAPSPS